MAANKNIPFFRANLAGNEFKYISKVLDAGEMQGGGVYTAKCTKWLQHNLNAKKALLTNSCSAALEMSAILANVKLGDEVLMPSYSFPSLANAFVLRGGIPRFVDIREDTLNIDERLIEPSISKYSTAICPVHYAGVACEMTKIMGLAKKHKLFVIEDAAQSLLASYKGKFLGTIGDFGSFSFHETKNINAGEGGALLVNRKKFENRSEYILEKGTNRSKFFRGEVDKYTWVDVGGSFMPSEMIAACLYAQLEKARKMTKERLRIWNRYFKGLKGLSDSGDIRLPHVPKDCEHNGHIFYIILEDEKNRTRLMEHLKRKGISTAFHFQPLHLSAMGKGYGYKKGQFPVTENMSKRILRLPMYQTLSQSDQEKVLNAVSSFFSP